MNLTDGEISRRTRRSFLKGIVAAVAGFGMWDWIHGNIREGSVPNPLRRVEDADDVFSRAIFNETHLARTFDASDINEARVNGDIGLGDDPDPDWRLVVDGGDSITLDQIKALPKIEQITQFKCVEGWNYIMKWSGTRLGDFAEKYGSTNKAWVGLETPDGEYYVGLDRASAMHPQTLLAYEMNGEPLTDDHGAPLRLLIPVKYGIKNLKRIGKITFTDTKPRDYWAENGYDYDSGF